MSVMLLASQGAIFHFATGFRFGTMTSALLRRAILQNDQAINPWLSTNHFQLGPL
jgi:hypothetical protein